MLFFEFNIHLDVELWGLAVWILFHPDSGFLETLLETNRNLFEFMILTLWDSPESSLLNGENPSSIASIVHELFTKQ